MAVPNADADAFIRESSHGVVRVLGMSTESDTQDGIESALVVEDTDELEATEEDTSYFFSVQGKLEHEALVTLSMYGIDDNRCLGNRKQYSRNIKRAQQASACWFRSVDILTRM